MAVINDKTKERMEEDDLSLYHKGQKLPPNVLIMVPVWERPEVFRYIAERLKGRDVLAIISPDDPHYDENLKTINENRFFTVVWDNTPVGVKMNAGIKSALGKYFLGIFYWDYLMGLNSDDILLDEYWEVIKKPMEEGYPMIGMNKVIAWHPETGRSTKLKLTDPSNPCKVWGGGRLIKREVLQKTMDKMGYVYQPDLNSGLDTSSQRTIFENLIWDKPPYIIDDCYLVDIKTETNINPYDKLLYVDQEPLQEGELEKYRVGSFPLTNKS